MVTVVEDQEVLNHFNCIKLALTSTLTSICGDEPEDKELHSGKDDRFHGIIGVISLVGEKESLSLMLGFPKETAIHFSKIFAGFEIEYESEDMTDVIGELANIVAGDAVARLDAAGLRVELSLPTVARGSDMSMMTSHDIASSIMNFELPSGQFWMKLAVGKDKRH